VAREQLIRIANWYLLGLPDEKEAGTAGKQPSQHTFLSRRSPHHSTLRPNSPTNDSEIAISEIKALSTRRKGKFLAHLACPSDGWSRRVVR